MQCKQKSNDLLRLLKTTVSLATAVSLFFWVSGTTAFSAEPSLSGQEPEPIETLIQVGQYRMNFKVIKGGNLTILLESGGGNDSNEWNRMAPDLAQKTGATVVSYDRAGLGKSDLPETPYDMREEIDWLWQGLKQLKLDKNLILVGHSYGGWLIRLFANDHPDAIRGMVFVDAFTTEFVDALGVEYLDNHPMMGKLPFPTTHPEKLTKVQRALVRVVREGLGPKAEVMRNTSVPKGIPVRVITCGKGFLPKPEEREAWRQSHEQMAASIEGAVLRVAEQSSHMIPWSQPDLIIETVTEIISLIKER
jgi:pimeloyl-ACP methyl ester carboxylesterase